MIGQTFVRRSVSARRLRNHLATLLLGVGFLVAILPLVSILAVTVARGMKRLDAEFFTHSMRGITGAGGGALHALMGTLQITGTAMILSIPIGIAAAVYITEYASARASRTITLGVDMLLGVPSIVAGLFAYALFSLLFADTGVRSGFIGAIALSVLMIPVVVRSAVEFFSLVSNELREASLALGVSRRTTVTRIVLPTAFGGLVTGIVLAVARVIGETAPLLIVAGYTASMNYNVFSERMMSLPVFVYTQYASQGPDPTPYLERAWAGALMLMAIVIALNLGARLLSRAIVRAR